MLKTRVIGVVVVMNELVVQSIAFERYLPVGRPTIAVEYLNRWGIDEIVLLDISATPEGRRPDAARISNCSRQAQVPLTVGGGIADIRDIERAIRSGADKVVLNTALFEHPELVSEGARLFGSQCIVASIDARRNGGDFQVLTRGGRVAVPTTVAAAARTAEALGAGEILITSVDRDGSKEGYDLELIGQVADAVRIPVIACGGVGQPHHLADGIRAGASAVAAANFFHFTEHSVAVAKRALRERGAEVRLDTLITYAGAVLTAEERVAKRDDTVLDRLRFEHVPEEVI